MGCEHGVVSFFPGGGSPSAAAAASSATSRGSRRDPSRRRCPEMKTEKWRDRLKSGNMSACFQYLDSYPTDRNTGEKRNL